MTNEFLPKEDGTVTYTGLCDCQVCVPSHWPDAKVEAFANTRNPTGITSKWTIRREGNATLNGDPERVQCDLDPDRVHIMLDC